MIRSGWKDRCSLPLKLNVMMMRDYDLLQQKENLEWFVFFPCQRTHLPPFSLCEQPVTQKQAAKHIFPVLLSLYYAGLSQRILFPRIILEIPRLWDACCKDKLPLIFLRLEWTTEIHVRAVALTGVGPWAKYWNLGELRYSLKRQLITFWRGKGHEV